MKTIELKLSPQELAAIIEGHLERTSIHPSQSARVTQIMPWSPPPAADTMTTLYNGAHVVFQLVPKDKA